MNCTMPALVNSRVWSPPGTSEEEGTKVCLCSTKEIDEILADLGSGQFSAVIIAPLMKDLGLYCGNLLACQLYQVDYPALHSWSLHNRDVSICRKSLSVFHRFFCRDDHPGAGADRLPPAGQRLWHQQPGLGQHHRPDPDLPGAGYFIGGPWADRSPYPATMYTILAWGAFVSGLVPLVARPVLRLAADAFDQLQVGVLFGSFTAVLILFSMPVTLLGTISPFAIRLAIGDPLQAGQDFRPDLCHLHPGLLCRDLPAGAGVDPAGRHHLDLLDLQRVPAAGGPGRALAGRRLASGAAYAWMPLVLLVLALRLGAAARSRPPQGKFTRPNRPITTSRCWSRTATACCA